MIAVLMLVMQQSQCPHPATDTAALAVTAVDRRPQPDSTNPPPAYPSLLRQAGVQGSVRISFVVDTAGNTEPRSMVIVRSPNPGFDQPVKRTVARWRFTPATACGLRARVRLNHEFAFRAGTGDTARIATVFEVDTSSTVSRDSLPDGTPRTTLAWHVTTVDLTPAPWDSARGDSAEEAVLALLIDRIPATQEGMARIVCLLGPPQHADYDPEPGRLKRLTRPNVAVLPYRRCPPTYVSMIRTPDERPYPPGEDPYHIAVLKRRAIAAGRMLFDVDVAQSTGGTDYLCGAERRDGRWKVRCEATSSWVS
jgi:TonB family protein